MSEDRIRDHVDGRRRSGGSRTPAEPGPGDRVTLYHRDPEGFGDGRVAEGTLVRFDPETVTIRREGGRKLGVRTEALASWEWEPSGGHR